MPYLRSHAGSLTQPLLNALIEDPLAYIQSTQLADALQEAGAPLDQSQVNVALRIARAEPSPRDTQWVQAHSEALRCGKDWPVSRLVNLLLQDRLQPLDPIRLIRALHDQQIPISLKSVRKAVKQIDMHVLGQQPPTVPSAPVSLAPHSVQSACDATVATNQLEHWVARHAPLLSTKQPLRQTLTRLLRSDPPAHLSPLSLACALNKMAGITMNPGILNRVIAASTSPVPEHMQRWVKERKHCFLGQRRPYQILMYQLEQNLPAGVQAVELWRALHDQNIKIGCSTVSAAVREAKAYFNSMATATSTHPESSDNTPIESPLPEIPADALAWLENLDTSPMNLPMSPEPANSHPTQAGHSNS